MIFFSFLFGSKNTLVLRCNFCKLNYLKSNAKKIHSDTIKLRFSFLRKNLMQFTDKGGTQRKKLFRIRFSHKRKNSLKCLRVDRLNGILRFGQTNKKRG